MEKLEINTPQNVNIEYNLASIGIRMLALALDIAVLLGYIYLVQWLFSEIISVGYDRWLMFGLLSLLYLPVLLYHFYMETLFKGQTLGKMALKIKVVKLDGTRASVYEYFIRWTMNIIDIWMMSGLIGAISTIISKKTQRVGDLAANTAVISLKPRLHLLETVYEDMNLSYKVVYPQVINLSDKDINLIKSKFNEARKNNNDVVIRALSKRLQTVFKIDAIKTSDRVFIKTVLLDYYHTFRK